MMKYSGFNNSRVLVCGLARSGFAAAKLLLNGGAFVTVSDLLPYSRLSKEQRGCAHELSLQGAKFLFGQNPEAVLKSFHYLVISPGVPIDSAFILKARSLGIPVLGELELGSMVCRASIAAITGTNGKTTATTITGDIFKKCFPGSLTMGNIGTALCERAAETSPDAWIALEVSSFQLESIRDFHPKIAAVLNISEDHLNRHYTMENYIATKERIFSNQQSGDALVLNYDDPVTRVMAKRAASKAAYFASSGEPMGDDAKDAHCVFRSNGDVIYRFKNLYETIWDARSMRSPFKHILEDALAAALIAIIAGADMKSIAEAVLEFSGVEHRVELVGIIDGVEYYNDSKATNVDAAVKALAAVDGRVILIGGGQNKNADFSPWTSLFPSKVKRLIVFGETAEQIINSCNIMGFTDTERVKDLRQSVASAKYFAKKGDRVLFSPACASLDMFKDFEERGNLFKKYVAEV